MCAQIYEGYYDNKTKMNSQHSRLELFCPRDSKNVVLRLNSRLSGSNLTALRVQKDVCGATNSHSLSPTNRDTCTHTHALSHLQCLISLSLFFSRNSSNREIEGVLKLLLLQHKGNTVHSPSRSLLNGARVHSHN